MSKKYHFNTKTGNPNICRAEKNCPFGGPEVHYATKEEARKGYEQRQSGSFPKPETKTRESGEATLWTEVSDYTNAPIGTVIEFADRTRFIKTNPVTWETSAHGGLALENYEIGSYPNRKGISPGSRVVKEDEPAEKSAPAASPTKQERPKGTLKASTLKQASYEEGMQARRYFLLINHRDPEQLAAASGKVQDQQLVEDIQKFNRLKAREAELQKAFQKAAHGAREAKSEAQYNGYRRVMEMKSAQLAELTPQLKAADDAITAHGKRYAKQLVIHRRSLDSIERLANQGIKSSPAGIKDRIYKLRKLQKETPSVKDLRSKLEGGKPQAVVAAAKEFGNPLYIKKAEHYASARTEVDRLNNEAAALQRTLSSVTSPKVKETAEAELFEIQKRQRKATAELEKASEGLKLFSDDLKARFEQEQDIARELKALQRFTS